MQQLTDICVPDIGDFTDVPIIEIYVKVGDQIKVDDSVVTLESDKATMDIPSSASGVVQEVLVKVGDRVQQGSLLLKVAAEGSAASTASATPAAAPTATTNTPSSSDTAGATVTVCVPDIGDYTDVPIIDIAIKVGDELKEDDTLVTLESDKATMDVPSSSAGKVLAVLVKNGDRVSQGSPLVQLATAGAPSSAATAPAAAPAGSATAPAAAPATPVTSAATQAAAAKPAPAPVSAQAASMAGGTIYASPSIRAYARSLGVNLASVTPSGKQGRILQEDVLQYVKRVMSGQASVANTGAPAATGSLGGGLDLLPWPKIDFSKFGPIETQPLLRIKKIAGQNLSRNWAMIPAVTYHEDADMTDLEAFRQQINKEIDGVKVTMLAFLIKAVVNAMQKYPEFNSSIDGDNLVLKKYYNIGFAADTPNGLVVPVIKGADQKSVVTLARESGALAKDAREGKLKPADMQGACFTISSLGGIGGTYFSPIINAPEVAILGVNKSVMKPVWDGKAFVPRLILPLSLTADHRVIDGALATRFNVYLAQLIADMRRLII